MSRVRMYKKEKNTGRRVAIANIYSTVNENIP